MKISAYTDLLKVKNTNIFNSIIFIFIFSFIFIFRVDSLLFNLPMNPDEAERITNAVRILHYGYTWNSVDGYSSGPLNSIILLWPKIFNIDVTYFTVRVTSIYLFSSIIFIIFNIFRNAVNTLFALIIISPLLSFYAFTKSGEFLHYSSEQLSVFFIVFAIYLCFRLSQLQPFKRYLQIILVGLIIGAIPFAKLQAVPVAIILWCWIVYQILINYKMNRSLNEIYVFMISFLLPSLFFLFPLLINNEISHFYNSYILWALNYVSEPLNFNNFVNLLTHDVGINIFNLYIQSTLFLFAILMIFSKSFSSKESKKTIWLVILIVLSSYYIVIKPGRSFPHYIHFFIPILIIVLGFQFEMILKAFRSMLIKILIYLGILFIFSNQLFLMYKQYGEKETIQNLKTLLNSFNSLVHNKNLYDFLTINKSENISLLTWGWMSDYYINKNIIPASREGMNQNQILNSNLQQYFQNRLINDINESKPNIIIDAVYKGAFGFANNEKYGIKSFNELSTIINNNYTNVSINSNDKEKPEIFLENEYLKQLYTRMIKIKDINASDFYDENVHYRNVNDFSVFEKSSFGKTIFDYWMLPDHTLGSIKFDFYNNEKLKLIKILNTTNGHFSGKSTKEVKINIFKEEKLIYTVTKELNKYPLWTDISFQNLEEATSVSIDILSYNGNGAGLNEVKFYRE